MEMAQSSSGPKASCVYFLCLRASLFLFIWRVVWRVVCGAVIIRSFPHVGDDAVELGAEGLVRRDVREATCSYRNLRKMRFNVVFGLRHTGLKHADVRRLPIGAAGYVVEGPVVPSMGYQITAG